VYNVASFAAGLLFGVGLILAGMANPAKVLGFLDVAGAWDPSLALVMAGAVGVGAAAFALMRGKTHTLLGAPVRLQGARKVDRRLVVGSLVFGAGWGLAGICPGPALVLAGQASAKGLAFLTAMLVGNALFEVFETKKVKRASRAHPEHA